MNGWERTKVTAAITAAIATALGAGWFGGRLVAPRYPGEPAYAAPGVTDPVDLAALQRNWPSGLDQRNDRSRLAGYMGEVVRGAAPIPVVEASSAPALPAPVADLGTLLAHADATKGMATAKICGSCHSFGQGEPDHTGPNLWGIIGRHVAARSSFAYSPAVAAQTGNWTYERLDHYLTSPARAIPGNKMGFAGLRNAEDRANLLAYLGTLATTPAPFPLPAAMPPSKVAQKVADATKLAATPR